jgi:hypothetical protein
VVGLRALFEACYDPRMIDGILGAIGLGIAAFCVWLGVHLFNLRPRWRARVAILSAAVLIYPLSLWPTCWFVQQGNLPPKVAATVYNPLFAAETYAPQASQEANVRLARALNVEATFVALRDTPYLKSYPVSDLVLRHTEAGPILDAKARVRVLNWITTTIDPSSWEDLSGHGRVEFSADGQYLDVWQSRRIHAQVAAFIEEIDSIRRTSLARGRELDAEAVWCFKFGFYEEPRLDPGCVVVCASRDKRRFVVAENSFPTFDALLKFLERLPKKLLHGGSCWYEEHFELVPADSDRLEALCRTRDVDLFVRPYIGNVIGQPLPRDWWVVRASDTIYPLAGCYAHGLNQRPKADDDVPDDEWVRNRGPRKHVRNVSRDDE